MTGSACLSRLRWPRLGLNLVSFSSRKELLKMLMAIKMLEKLKIKASPRAPPGEVGGGRTTLT